MKVRQYLIARRGNSAPRREFGADEFPLISPSNRCLTHNGKLITHQSSVIIITHHRSSLLQEPCTVVDAYNRTNKRFCEAASSPPP
jgi:hypothetical protein